MTALHEWVRGREPSGVPLAGPLAPLRACLLTQRESCPAPGPPCTTGPPAQPGAFLINFRPRYLIIDELEKMTFHDFSVLLSLMQSGTVARLKKGMRSHEQMNTWALAEVNRRDRWPGWGVRETITG